MKSEIEQAAEIWNLVGTSKFDKALKNTTLAFREQLSTYLALLQAAKEGNFEAERRVVLANQFSRMLDEASEKIDEGNKKSTLASELLYSDLSSVSGVVRAILKVLDKMPLSVKLAVAGVAGFVKGFTSSINLLNRLFLSTVGLLTQVAVSIVDISMAIINIPFRVLSSLIQTANKLAPLMEAIARETEEVRKQFGELNTATGGAVMTLSQKLSPELNKFGFNAYKIFGSTDEVIAGVNKLATDMGASFSTAFKDFARDGAAMILLQKGLGITGENMGKLEKKSRGFGTTLVQQLVKITKFSTSFAKGFGLSSKEISRDISKMSVDVKHFGNLAPKELAMVSVYARKLSLDVEELTGVIDKFDTFEDAATSTAMLSQAFGAQADAIKLMRAENPADRIDELRRAMYAAGQSAETMNRQELKLLSQTVGLGEEAVQAAFSQKNLGVSMDELRKRGVIAENQQLSTAKAINQVRNSIEKVIKPFVLFSSYMEAFLTGFSRELFGIGSFNELLKNIFGTLQETPEAGKKVGAMFKELFPGVNKVIASFTKFFSIEEGAPFKKFLVELVEVFGLLFSEIHKGPGAVTVFFSNFQSSISKLFGSFDSENAESGLQEFVSAFGNIFAGLIREASKSIASIANMLASFISTGEIPKVPGSNLASSLINPIINELSGAVSRIGAALVDLFNAVWEKYGDRIKSVMLKIALAAGAYIFVSSTISALASIFAAWMLSSLVAALPAIITGLQAFATSFATVFNATFGPALSSASYVAGGLSSSIMSILSSAFSFVLSSIPASVFSFASSLASIISTTLAAVFSLPGLLIAAFLGLTLSFDHGMDTFYGELSKNFGSAEAKLGSIFAGLLDVLTLGLMPDDTLKDIANWIAELAKSFFEGFESLFGSNTKDLLVSGFESFLQPLLDLGDLIFKLFTGDTAKIEEGAFKLVMSLVDAFKIYTWTIPSLVVSVLGQALIWMIGQGLGMLLDWLGTTGFQFVGTILKSFGALIVGLFKGIITVIGGLFASIIELAFGKSAADSIRALFAVLGDLVSLGLMTVINVFVAGIETVGQIVSLIGSVLQTGFNAIRSIFSGDKLSAATIEPLRKWLVGLAKWGSNLGKSLSDGWTKFWNRNKFISGPVKAFMDVAGAAMRIFGISSPSKLFEDIGKNVSEGFQIGIKDLPKKAGNAISKTAESSSDAAIASLDGYLDRIEKLIDTITKLSLIAGIKTDALKKPGGYIGGLSKVVSDALDVFEIVFSKDQLARLTAIGETIASSVDIEKINKINETFDQLTNIFETALSGAENMISLQEMANKIMPSNWVSTSGTENSPTVMLIRHMINEANAINRELSDIAPLNVNAKLEKLSKSLGIDGKKFQVEQGKINLVINLNVTMEAKELADVLSEHGIVSTQKQ